MLINLLSVICEIYLSIFQELQTRYLFFVVNKLTHTNTQIHVNMLTANKILKNKTRFLSFSLLMFWCLSHAYSAGFY